VGWLVDATLLVLAGGALSVAGLRAASALGASAGLARPVCAAPLVGTAMVCEALLLAPLGLGSHPVALTAAALATAVIAVRLLPAGRPVLEEIGSWAAGLRALPVAGACAAAGVVAAWSAWLVANPHVGGDGALYHLPKVASWVDSGAPGSLETLLVDNPYGYYPGTNEVALTWLTGISHSLVPLTLWSMPVLIGLLGASVVVAARALGAAPGASLLAAVAVCTGPLVSGQASGPFTDLPALAWVACAVALAAMAHRDRAPALIAPLILAVGLAVGTKTTAAPLAAVALGGGLLATRGRLRGAAPLLAGAAVAALVTGSLWYWRNLVDNGWPFWPFTAAPWGEPVPPALAALDGRLIADPVAGALSRPRTYADYFGGHLIVLAGALIAPLIVRRRAVAAAAAVTAGMLLVWSAAPTTGFPADSVYDPVAASAFRYAMPALISAAIALALTARGGRGARLAAFAVLAAAIVANAARIVALGPPVFPAARWLVLGAAGGAVAGLLGRRLAERPGLRDAIAGTRRSGAARRGALAAGGLAAAALIALAGPGYVDRHLESFGVQPAVRSVLTSPGYAERSTPVAMAPYLNGVLAGPGITHSVELVGLGESCDRVRARARAGWLILDLARGDGAGVPELRTLETPSRVQAPALARCMDGVRPAFAGADWLVYGPAAGDAR